ncbi:holliday junction ATP-dependent DNA helicase ruvA [Mycobacterium xenopi 4042]|uniref:Holliday junction ATP-dependent DNA helicase ruvA n=1 Tax=Mycobacterium xenopi 4042 TaxID=1299334 RepID=X8DL25_MYCXE|nr:holliday junction ATP-dependent DNA helicase ruvA [Mycobacterium xenopi 4042]
MIASVRGEVLEVALDHAVIEAAGSATGSTRRPRRWRRCDAAAKPADHRDDRARGFDDALRFSRQRDPRPVPDVVGVSGVGPKIALATLAVYDTAALRKALADGDVAALTGCRASASAAPKEWCSSYATRSANRSAECGRQRSRGAPTRGGRPCRPWVCGQASGGGHRRGADQRPRRHHRQRAARRPVAVGKTT